jgi:DNA helicase HerA-like ATPase
VVNIAIGLNQKKKSVYIRGKFANRHGLVTGVTGTGKTVTIQTLAENFSKAGVPVFMADIKGDVSGLAMPQQGQANPVNFWDSFGKQGRGITIPISELGPELIARLLELSEAQAGCLEVAFCFAQDRRIRLHTIDDLQSLLNKIIKDKDNITRKYGLVSVASISAVQRSLLRLRRIGGTSIFDRASFTLNDFMLNTGRNGDINILAASELVKYPQIYATFMAWLLTSLYNNLPEVGDIIKPKLALFIDEAHLLFTDCPNFLLKKIEQIIRLIRSKGVGVYFVTQSPKDIPANIAAQLGNKIQHAIRDVGNPSSALKVGQANVSVIDDSGQPTVTETVNVYLPKCKLGAVPDSVRKDIIGNVDVNVRDICQHGDKINECQKCRDNLKLILIGTTLLILIFFVL